jgi:hypothetical protein
MMPPTKFTSAKQTRTRATASGVFQGVEQCVLDGGYHLTTDRQQYEAQAELHGPQQEQLQQIDRAEIERGGERPDQEWTEQRRQACRR